MLQLSSVHILYAWNPEDITIIVYKVNIHLDLSTLLAFWLLFTSQVLLLFVCEKEKKVFMFTLTFEW